MTYNLKIVNGRIIETHRTKDSLRIVSKPLKKQIKKSAYNNILAELNIKVIA